MISQQAKQGIDYIFAKSVKANLALSPGDVCDIQMLSGNKSGEFSEKSIVVLTITSFLFRVLTIFHVDEGPEMRNYFLKGVTDKTFLEVFSEIGNLCAGSMNRYLLHHFPHLGMSTPYILDGRCIQFINELNPGYLSRHAITINDSVRLQATLCMCVYAPIDFVVDKSVTEEETGGLELF